MFDEYYYETERKTMTMWWSSINQELITQTKKSLLGMPSKREGFIQPSVTSQPPRLAALIRNAGFGDLP